MKRRKFLWRRQNGICPWCERAIEPRKIKNATVDHVVPKSHGGVARRDNIQLLHERCNYEKADICVGCETCQPLAAVVEMQVAGVAQG
jgi:5-methylcytosine-specific restriction endonuclease McrA